MSQPILSLSIMIALLTGCGADGHNGGSCHVTKASDGTAILFCDDGSSATINNGKDGADGKDGQDGEDSASCAIPPSTLTMLTDWIRAASREADCLQDVMSAYHRCEDNGTGGCDQSGRTECINDFISDINHTPSYTCGAVLYTGTSIYDYQIVEEDTDGDGISNYWEYEMGYNPCSPNSFGSCVNDADLDFDNDGVRNGIDPTPYCNGCN